MFIIFKVPLPTKDTTDHRSSDVGGWDDFWGYANSFDDAKNAINEQGVSGYVYQVVEVPSGDHHYYRFDAGNVLRSIFD